MASLQIENLPDELYDRLKTLADLRNFAIDEFAICLLVQAIQTIETEYRSSNLANSMSEVLAEIRSRPRVNPVYFGLPDSTVLIREDRDR